MSTGVATSFFAEKWGTLRSPATMDVMMTVEVVVDDHHLAGASPIGGVSGAGSLDRFRTSSTEGT